MDEPLVWYEGSGTSDRRWLHADERGSIIGAFNSGGGGIGYVAYDEYGRRQAWGNPGRFGFTGQQWLPQIGMHYFRARIYDQGSGRFMQTDPIGYGGGMNIYAYVGADPVNLVDPSGLSPDLPCNPIAESCERDIRVTGSRIPRRGPSGQLTSFSQGTGFPQDAGCGYSFADLRDYCFAEQERREAEHPFAALFQPQDAKVELACRGRIRDCINALGSFFRLLWPTGHSIRWAYRTHSLERLRRVGITAADVEPRVRAALNLRRNLQPGQHFTGSFRIGDRWVEYRAYVLPNGEVNVGTIFPLP